MKNRHFLFAILATISVITFGLYERAQAQSITSTTPTQFIAVGAHTSCALSVASQSNLCLAGDGLWLSTNGSSYCQLGASGASACPAGTAAAPSLTINGTTKTLPASFTIAGTSTAPTVTSTATAPTSTITAN